MISKLLLNNKINMRYPVQRKLSQFSFFVHVLYVYHVVKYLTVEGNV